MKKVFALLLAVLLTAFAALPALAADDAAVLAAPAETYVNAASAKVILTGSKKTAVDDIFYVTVRLSGCAGLTSADLKFSFDPAVLTYLGGALLGAAGADENLTAAFSDIGTAAADGVVSVSFFHLEELTVEEGNTDFCELAFRAGSGSSAVKASAETFQVGDTALKASFGKCKFSAGGGDFLKKYGAVILIVAVAVIMIVVLIVLLIVIHNLKKKAKIATETFDETPPAAADETAADNTPAEDTAAQADDAAEALVDAVENAAQEPKAEIDTAAEALSDAAEDAAEVIADPAPADEKTEE